MIIAVDSSKPFETRDLGTDELLWRSFLETLDEWEPRYPSLTVVAPHPDDETLGAGGLIHTYAQRGEPIRVVLVTDGELACPEVENLADRSYPCRYAPISAGPARYSFVNLDALAACRLQRSWLERRTRTAGPRVRLRRARTTSRQVTTR